jgi:hypothetical protein
VAYKRKVQLQAPIKEWALWVRHLKDDENGRVIFRNGAVTVAIVRPVTRKDKKKAAAAKVATETKGNWASQDQSA